MKEVEETNRKAAAKGEEVAALQDEIAEMKGNAKRANDRMTQQIDRISHYICEAFYGVFVVATGFGGFLLSPFGQGTAQRTLTGLTCMGVTLIASWLGAAYGFSLRLLLGKLEKWLSGQIRTWFVGK